MITITENATKRIKEILEEESNPNNKLRIFVQGGGCSGMQYGFTFDEETTDEDVVVEVNGINLLVDSMSSMYLQGATIDYKEELMGSSFKIDNPNAQTSCGCGASFSPY